MNRLQIALQGYASLAPALSSNLSAELSDDIERWLELEVCPAVEQLGETKRFQSAALWSVNHFSHSESTDERKLVLKVEQNLINLAAGIASLIDVAEKEAPAGDPEVAEFKGLHRETVGYIANKPWFDLVCTQDFFSPIDDLHLRTGELDYAHIQAFRKRNVQLPLGDYVTRLLLNRVGCNRLSAA